MTLNDIKPERAVESDCDEICALENLCFSDPWPKEAILAQISGEGKITLIVRKNGRIAGYIGMMYVLDEGYISNLAVLPEFRRTGVGKALVSGMAQTSKELKLSFLSLEARQSNTAAVALYEAQGFGIAGIRKAYYEKPREDALIMTMFLS
ncbi:MAG: ribosomal protein S18-alanine N-acetyltransferase [Oscillospiraceae bacterium]|nr:ribosomal protein S18-alanine N-acetyltransferase [Oscillospiraceae bacterium]